MKKFAIAAALCLSIVFSPISVSAQVPIQTDTQYRAVLQQLISLLLQQISQLQAQLIALQSQTSEVPVGAPVEIPEHPNLGKATPAVPVEEVPALPDPKTITLQGVGTDHLTILNDTGVSVRVKKLSLASSTILGVRVQGTEYSPEFSQSGRTFNLFACNGAGSLGTVATYGNPRFDPCVRKDAQVAKNELAPGESMEIRLSAPVKEVVYESGSVVETVSGNDIQF